MDVKHTRKNRSVAKSMRGFDAEALRKKKTKDAQLNIRLTSEDRQSIEETAEEYGLSVSDYILSLHRYATGRKK